MDISLFYFADDAEAAGSGRYDLLLDGARFADEAGLQAVWTPERHFHRFGGLYANPAVTGAAVAAVTRRVRVCAGSVVLPLHDPIRVAEEWAMVDNLSNGRAAMAFASGWHATDFALAPQAEQTYTARRALVAEQLQTVRRLWQGKEVERTSGAGERVTVRVYPAPVQSELPFWMTSSGNQDTFRAAGELGGNVLTHLLGQRFDVLRRNIATYREARSAHDGGPGRVTLMLHTFLGESDGEVREQIREPFTRYLLSSLDLIAGSSPTTGAGGLSDENREVLVRRSFDRYARDSALFGSLETATRMVRKLSALGVDEIACLVDFGVDRAEVMRGLGHLAQLVRTTR